MRVVTPPHQVLHADEVPRPNPNWIIFEGGSELAVPVVARLARQRVAGDLAAVARPGMVRSTQKVADPAGLELRRYELQAGKTLADAADDQMHERHFHADIRQRRV